MPLGVSAQEISVGDLFGPGRFMSMPLYQRSYSWAEEEAVDLFSDLLEAFESEVTYFLGAVVFVEDAEGDADKPDEIVDGQQRLTTLTMMLACLRDLETAKTRSNRIHELIEEVSNEGSDTASPQRFRLSLNHPDEAFYRQTVQQRGATRTAFDDDTNGSQARIVSSLSALMKKLRPMSDKDRRNFFDWLIDNVAFVRVVVSDRSEGYKVFRVLNTRGKKPSTHDIIKSDLFEKAGFTLAQADAQSRIWTEHEARLGGQTFDDLLRQIRIIYDKSQKGDVLTGFRRSIISKVDIDDFLTHKLPAYVEAHDEIRIGRVDLPDNSGLVNERLDRLRALDHKTWQAPALKFLVTYRETNGKAGDPASFFINLERLAYVMQILGVERVPRNRRYRKLLDLIETGKWTYSGDMTTYKGGVVGLFGSSGPFMLSREECRRVRENLGHRTTTFSKRRALALRLNACIEGGRTVPPEADATVEHVFPRKPKEGSLWDKRWPRAKDRQDLTDTIGNFTLLPHVLNQKVDRLDFDDKKKLYFNDGKGADFALSEDIGLEALWTPETVRRRTERLIDILCADWGIPEG